MTQRLDPLATAIAGLTVQRWIDELSDTDLARQEKRAVLEEFCRLHGETPDGLIASLFRPGEEHDGDGQVGERMARAGNYALAADWLVRAFYPLPGKERRREVIQWIEIFERAHGGRPAGNVIRSFLIHNGVIMTARATW